MFDFVALDLETTGLDYDTSEIIEIALVRFRNGKPAESLDNLVKPKGELRSFIARLTGITAEELAQARPFSEVISEVLTFIGDLPLVAHNAQFDSHFLRKQLREMDCNPTLTFYDSLTAARIAFHDAPNHKLQTLVQHLDIDRTASHRALPDAVACGSLFVLCLQKMETFSDFAKTALQKLAKDMPWAKVFPTAANETLHWQIQEFSANMAGELSKSAQVPKRVSNWFGNTGFLNSLIPEFRDIAHQRDMAECAERNMHKGGTLVVEASPGMGKTLAYLVPAILRASQHGERVVIATATRTLQEQIWTQDLPRLMPAVGDSLRPALLKGRSNYLCLRKFHLHLNNPDLLSMEEREPFMTLIPWVEITRTGDASESNCFNLARNRQLWGKLASEASSCVGPSCVFHSRCFGLNSRRRAAEANLVITNHALFLQDMALDFSLLPTYEHIVFDEAHRLPNASHQALGKDIWFYRLRNLLKILTHVQNPERGLFAEAEKLCSQASFFQDFSQCRDQVIHVEKQFQKFLVKVGKGSRKNASREKAALFKESTTSAFDADPKPFLQQMDILCGQLQNLAQNMRQNFPQQANIPGMARDFEGIYSELMRLRTDVDFVTHGGRADWVYWLEEPINPHTLHIKAAPLEPGNTWREKFFPWVRSSLFTSGTLAMQGNFDHFSEQMGLLHGELTKGKEPFVRLYRDSAPRRDRVVVANFLPKPSDGAYQSALEDLLAQILPSEKRNTLVLFTSIQSLEGAHARLSPLFEELNKPLYAQNTDGSAEGLLELFRHQRGACLLGTQSLWEGVDLPGEALQLLVIPKLPFPSPTEPLVAARADVCKQKGGNAFKEIFIPEAILTLRQGMGRLLRSPTDSGTILLLDSRILSEGYGANFARLWDRNHRVATNAQECLPITEA